MTNRSRARELVSQSRRLLIEAAKEVDGDLETIRHNITSAIVANDDILDALQLAVEADLREWADAHGERSDVLTAEAMGEL